MWNGFFRRAPAKVEPVKHALFDSVRLDTTFDELQKAVLETTTLASDISSHLANRLHVTEQALLTVMCVITEGIIITDKNCIIQEWNTGAEIIFGYTAEQAIGQHVCLIVQGDAGRADIRNRFDQSEYSERGNVNRIRPLKCYAKNGEELLVEISINAFPDATSHDPRMIAIVRDITAQHQEHLEREREHRLLSTVIEAISDVVIVRDGDGRWILLNKAAYALYGFHDESQFLMKTNQELAEEYPFFSDHLLHSAETDAEAWTSRRTVRFETEVVDFQNQKQFFDVLKTPIYSKDRHREMLVILARNITNLKEKREHINVAYKALNASSDIVIITDHLGQIQFVNKMFLIKYRFVDMRDVLGQKMSVVRSPKTTLERHKQMWDTITTGKTWEGIITNQDTTGKELTVDSTIIPIIDHTLSAQYYICVQKCIDC